MQNDERLTSLSKKSKELTKRIIDILTTYSGDYLDVLNEIVLLYILSDEDQCFNRVKVETMYFLTGTLKTAKELKEVNEELETLVNNI
jgi:hypothetical protein